MSHALPAWQAAIEAESPEPSLRRILMASLVIIAAGFGGFFAWAFTAPLDSAVPANGTIVVESKRKTVRLLDAGILRTLYVKEGDRVEPGQPLFRLDEAQARAQLGSLSVQRWTIAARMARLRAEQNDQTAIAFPADLTEIAEDDPAVADLVTNERRVFQDRLAAYEGKLAVQRARIGQLQDQIKALRAQAEATRSRVGYIEKELEGVELLLAKGYATKTKLYELKRAQAELRGNLGELTAKEAEARQAIGQTELEIQSLRSQRHQEVSRDLQEAQAAAADLAERIRGAEDTLERKLVSAPEAGIVTDLKFVTAGSSIGAGQPVLDIVPQDDRMMVEVQVRPDDIEQVHPGQRVNIRLTAYRQQKVPVLTGKLVYVSADRQQDQRGDTFFVARAEIDAEVLREFTGVALSPGMPAEVLIIGGERTAIDYFTAPIRDSLRRSFREY